MTTLVTESEAQKLPACLWTILVMTVQMEQVYPVFILRGNLPQVTVDKTFIAMGNTASSSSLSSWLS